MHITTATPPLLRIDGSIVPLQLPPLGPVETKQLCFSVLTEEQRAHFEKHNELDLSFGVKGLSRFRANIYMQRGAVAGAFRAIPFKILTLRGARPAADRGGIRRASRAASSSSPGRRAPASRRRSRRSSTRSTPSSACTSSRSRTRSSTCIRTSSRSSTSARWARDTEGFKSALKYVLRQDPDVVLVGEMRDLETIEAALTISETGHLVFATLHTNSAVSTINRIIDVFPPHQQAQVRDEALVRAPGGRLPAALAATQARPGGCWRSRCSSRTPRSATSSARTRSTRSTRRCRSGRTSSAMQTLNQSLFSLFQQQAHLPGRGHGPDDRARRAPDDDRRAHGRAARVVEHISRTVTLGERVPSRA